MDLAISAADAAAFDLTPFPSVSSVTPGTATLGLPITLIARGQNLPLTAVLSVADGSCQTPTNRTSTSFATVCTFNGTAGVKAVSIKTDLPANSGTIIDASRSVTVSAPSATLPVFTSGVALSQTTGAISARWNTATGTVTGYELYRSTASGTLGSRIYQGPAQTYNDTAVTTGTKFYYTAKACNTTGCTTGGQDFFTYTLSATLPIFTSGVALVQTSNSIRTSWNAASGTVPVAVYELYRSTAGGTLGSLVYRGPLMTYNDTFVTIGTKYYYTAKACNSAGECVTGTQDFMTHTPSLSPPVFTSGVALSQTTGAISTRWNVATGTVTWYELYRATVGGTLGNRIYQGPAQTYEDIAVVAGTKYYYTAKACNSAGCTTGAQDFFTYTPAPTLPVFTSGVALSQTSNSISTRWNAATGTVPVAAYELYRSTSSGTLGNLVYLGPLLTYNDTSVTTGTTYYYTVKACNAAGGCTTGTQDFFTYAPSAALPVFSSGVALSQITGGIGTRWNAATGTVTRYELYRSTASGTLGSLIYQGTALSFDDASLTASATYYYTAKACNTTGCTQGGQNYMAYSPPVALPGFSSGVALSQITGGIGTRWNAATGTVTRYELYRSTASGTLGSLIYQGTGLSFDDASLTASATYYYTAKACNTAGCTQGGQNYMAYSPPVALPGFSSGVALSQITGGIGTRWNAATGTVTRYELYRSTASGTLGSLIYQGTGLSFDDIGMTTSATYYYTAKACNAAGGCTTGTQSYFQYTPQINHLPVVTNFWINNATTTTLSGGFTVTDEDYDSLTKVRVHVGRTPGSSQCQIDVGGDFASIQAAGVKTFTSSNCASVLTAAGTYHAKVEAHDLQGGQASVVSTTFTYAPPVAVILSISPGTATLGVSTVFTVTGLNLPLTAVMSIPDGNCLTPTNRTTRGFTVVCTPGGAAGDKALLVKTDVLANGGTPIVSDSTYSVAVSAAAPTVFGTINVSPLVKTVFDAISFWVSNAYQTVKTVVWNFGAGIAEVTATVVNGVSTTVSQVFTTTGVKTVTATYKDAGGTVLGQSSVTFTVTQGVVTTTAAITSVKTPAGVAIASGGSTTATLPVLAGTLSTALRPVEVLRLYDGATLMGLATVTNTTWTFTPATALPLGTHSLAAVVARADGVEGTRSTVWTLVVVNPPAPTPTGLLPDTGITASQCYQAGSDVWVSCTSAGALALNDKQDGMVGRDVSSPGAADGHLGLSYSTVGSYAKEECVKDNITGLTWEGKTATGLRAGSNMYTNYSDGRAGDASAYVAAVNASALCGYTDWRLPEVDELQGLLDYSVATPGPAIDSTWFPNTPGNWYWSATSHANDANGAWFVYFSDGYVLNLTRNNTGRVRLVR